MARRDGSAADHVISVAHAFMLALLGREREALVEARDWPTSFGTPSDLAGANLSLAAAHTLMCVGDLSRARRMVDSAADGTRQAGALGILIYPLGLRSTITFRGGDWIAAYADASEALRLASVGTRLGEAVVLHQLASVEVGLAASRSVRPHRFFSGAQSTSRPVH